MLLLLIDEFAQATFKSRVPESQKTNVRGCRTFLRTLPPGAELAAFNTAQINRFLRTHAETHRPRTCRKVLAGLRAFGDWLVDKKHLTENPADAVRTPKLDKPHRDRPTTDQVRAMLDACDRIYNPQRRALAIAVVSLLAYAAIRRSEMLSLRLQDVDLAEGSLYIRGKGGKPRTIYPSECIPALRNYLDARPQTKYLRLLIGRRGPLGHDGLRTLLRELMEIAGMPGNKAVLPHGIRHYCATHMHRNGVELEALRDYLGHSDVATTAIYVHAEPDRARQIGAAAALPPRDIPPPPTPIAAPTPQEPPARPPWLRLVDGTGGGESH